MNDSTPQPTDWHRRPKEGGPCCPICGLASRKIGIHRRLRACNGAGFVYQKRRKGPKGWQVIDVRSRRQVSTKKTKRKANTVKGKARRGSLALYLHCKFMPDQLADKSDHTKQAYVKAVTKLCLWAGHDIPLAEVNEGVIAQFVDALEAEGLGKDTRVLYRCCLRRIIRHARPGECPKWRGRRPHENAAIAVDDESLAVEGSVLRFFQEAYLPHRMVGSTASSIEQVTVAIRKFSRYLGRPAMLTDLNDETVTGFLGWLLDQGFTRPTVNNKRACILAVWRHAYRRRLVERLPDVEKLKEYRRLPVAWTVEELGQLLGACSTTPGMLGDIPARLYWPAMVLLMFDTGLRLGATLSIESEHLDLATGWLIVPSEVQKQKVEQRFLLSGQTIEAIKRIFDPTRRLLFPWPLGRRQIWIHYGKILARTGLSNGRTSKFHRIRRTTASHLCREAGIDAASRQLGHSGVYLTGRYVDPTIARSQIDGVVHLPRPEIGGNGDGRLDGGDQTE